jgi:hypothetical protein
MVTLWPLAWAGAGSGAEVDAGAGCAAGCWVAETVQLATVNTTTARPNNIPTVLGLRCILPDPDDKYFIVDFS